MTTKPKTEEDVEIVHGGPGEMMKAMLLHAVNHERHEFKQAVQMLARLFVTEAGELKRPEGISDDTWEHVQAAVLAFASVVITFVENAPKPQVAVVEMHAPGCDHQHHKDPHADKGGH